MKPIFLFLLFFFCVFIFSSAQNPLVKMWDHRYGGDELEYLYSLVQTPDGGFILGGFSESGISGDKTENNRGQIGITCDYWIVKLDSIGVKQWDKRFGGFKNDELHFLSLTSDGGYILGGTSLSTNGLDKTEANRDPSNLTGDYWIVKVDSAGNKLWDKTFGGSSWDGLYSVKQTKDGGYILGGWSSSNISGDKTQDSWGGATDYWVVKTDSLGVKQWDRRFGGLLGDQFSSLIQTDDGGFILAGLAQSGIGGDKTLPSQGGSDYWIVKIDTLGNKLWEKVFGGNGWDNLYCLLPTNDNGLLLAGHSVSGISGDKTQGCWGDADWWIVKTDSALNKLWDVDLGGINGEEFYCASKTRDGGFLLSGDTYSPVSGNKTEPNMGLEQTWVVKINSTGGLMWDKTILTQGHDESGQVMETENGCIVIANWGDGVIGGYKSEAAWNSSSDFWIIKFCDTVFHADFTSANFLCPGTCVDFINLSISANNYQWNFPGGVPDTSTAANPSNICYVNPGTYDVTLIASNANRSDTLTLQNYITVFPHPAPQSIVQSGDTLSAIAGASYYQWYYNGNLIPGATNYFHVAQSSGDYNVVATDSNGCEVEAVINDVIAGIPQLAVGSLQLAIFPNPVTTTLNVRGLKNNTADEIKIFNVYGEKVFEAVHCKLLPINIGTNCQLFPSGLYYLEITSDKKIYRAKFIKQ